MTAAVNGRPYSRDTRQASREWYNSREDRGDVMRVRRQGPRDRDGGKRVSTGSSASTCGLSTDDILSRLQRAGKSGKGTVARSRRRSGSDSEIYVLSRSVSRHREKISSADGKRVLPAVRRTRGTRFGDAGRVTWTRDVGRNGQPLAHRWMHS